ncbi:hypothetical protein BGZ46_006248 [Entomortierella lignicola]|nr:hypothetical protein BGZ46_006248 [Entomortierella lignicola]
MRLVCSQWTLQIVYISVISALGGATIVATMQKRFQIPQFRWVRSGLFLALGLSGLCPIIHGIVLYGFPLAQKAAALNYMFCMGAAYVFGVLIYGSRTPECFFPGKFDNFGASHQIFHICVLIGCTVHFAGVIKAMSFWHDNDPTCAIPIDQMKIMFGNAAFGPRINPEGIILTLIAVESLDVRQETTACRPVIGAPINTSWVALVERGGDCSFVDKVRNMQASGANAVVVGDNQYNGLITMYAREDTSDVHIPSVFIAQRHYRELRYLGMEYHEDFLIQMTPDDLNWSLLDVVIFIILSPAFVAFVLYYFWRIRVRQQHVAELAPTEIVTNLPIKVFYSAKLKENDPVECVICLEDFEDETELRVLPCRHEYHVACIDNWLTTRKKFVCDMSR